MDTIVTDPSSTGLSHLPRKACHNTYEKAINSCGGVDIVLESSSAEYRHSRQFSHTPVYPGLYPQRPIEAIILPAKSYLAPLFSYIAPLMSSKSQHRRPVALYHSLPPRETTTPATRAGPPDHQRAGISPAENDPEAAVRLLSRTRLRERKRLATNSTPSDMRALLSRHCSCWGGR